MEQWWEAFQKLVREAQNDRDEDEKVLEFFPDMFDASSASQADSTTDVKRGGSRPGRRPNLPGDRVAADLRIRQDYFDRVPLYGEKLFTRRFRMG